MGASTPNLELSPSRLAVARARRRKTSRGAIMFIVAMTLTLLAAMGAYALTMASVEVKTSGFVRQSIQTHYLGEWGILGATEELGTDGDHIRSFSITNPSTSCPSLAGVPAFGAGTPPTTALDEACLMLRSAQLTDPTKVNPMSPLAAATPPLPVRPWLSAASPGDLSIPVSGDFVIEYTDPVDLVAENTSTNNDMVMQKMTVTVTGLTAQADGGVAGEGIETQRVRVNFGPIRKMH